MIYLIDLDDTLVYTTELNNDAYMFALEKYNLPGINCGNRITRQDLTCINEEVKCEVIRVKQEYFMLDWLPYRVVVNEQLLNRIRTVGKRYCYIWTSADRCRAKIILNKCGLSKYFSGIIIDEKTDFNKSIRRLKAIFGERSFIFYENNYELLNSNNIVDGIRTSLFNVNGYVYNI